MHRVPNRQTFILFLRRVVTVHEERLLDVSLPLSIDTHQWPQKYFPRFIGGSFSRFHFRPFLVASCQSFKHAVVVLFFKKWANPGLFFVHFQPFQKNIISIFTTNICEKCPSSIRCRDSYPRPLERESLSLPITTRPGLPPHLPLYFINHVFIRL